MKVLMIPSWYPTEEDPLLGTFYKEQAEACAARGMDVAVCYVNVSGSFDPRHHGIRKTVENGVTTYRYTHPNYTPRFERGRCIQRTHMLERLYRRLEREWGRPDVVNLRSSLQGYEAVSLCRKHGLPLFFMEHSSYVVTEGEGSPARARLRTVMEQAAVNACVGSTLNAVLHPIDPTTRIIPDFVDGERFRIMDVPPHDGFLFRAMGQLRPIKGHDTLICAFAAACRASDVPMRLEIAGTGALRESLQALIESEGVADRCTLVGRVSRDEVPAFMNGCDVFMCSSNNEMLSCVLMECAACGRPAIATACGGPQDILTEETGVLVPVGDVQAMADAMVAMTGRAAAYDRDRIREVILEKFGKDTVCRQLAEACADAAGEGAV